MSGHRMAPGGVIHSGSASLPCCSRGTCQPVAVIAYEDREQVERLVVCVYEQPFKSRIIDQWAAALREFANPTPPKPDEPQGLGAVVEDARGHLHTRARNHSQPWVGGDGIWRPWVDIDAVTSLSEGVKEGDR